MIGYLRPSLAPEAQAYKKDIRRNFVNKPKKRGGTTNATMTPDLVRWVRANARRNGGSMSYAELAERVGLTISGIKCIVSRITWKDVE